MPVRNKQLSDTKTVPNKSEEYQNFYASIFYNSLV